MRQRESDDIVHWLRESVNGNEICHSILVERKRKRESEKVDPVHSNDTDRWLRL